MAMVVKNNLSALNTLNTLNVNNSELAKSLKKVSSGMRITGAGDDASGYAIGKGMEVMVRALGQDIENTQTGKNLIATAEKGMQEIVSNIRSMKELVLNAMNDHNSDVDRETLQKEYLGRMETITNIAASTEYNGRLLLNGDYFSPSSMRYGAVDESTSGLRTGNIAANATGSTAASGVNSVASGSVTPNSIVGLFAATGLPSTPAPSNMRWATGLTGVQTPTPVPNGNATPVSSVVLNFSGATRADGTTPAIPSDFDNQGFTFNCVWNNGGCSEYVSIKFSASTPIGTGQVLSTTADLNNEHHEYVVGISDATSFDDLERAVFEGIKSLTDGWSALGNYPSTPAPFDPFNTDGATRSDVAQVSKDFVHNVQITKVGNDYVLSERSWAMWIYDGVRQSNPSPEPDPIPDPYTRNSDWGNPLIIHHGPKQNQHLRVYINSMHPIALHLNGTALTPWEKAAHALSNVDFALEYSLNEITRMGAYQSRLDETEDNLVTGQENTQSAESTMQDADMAKEMATYTKNNVLTQSAQSMLSQANQNVGSVLDLLQ